MFDQPGEFEPLKLAAILYGAEDDVDTLLADFAEALAASDVAVGGIVQRNLKAPEPGQCAMQAIDLMTGRMIPISQPLGNGATACRLDTAGLAEASLAIAHAVESEVALVIVNKFSKQEAAGGGLRAELARAVVAGLPTLTAVPEKCLHDWEQFTGGRATMLGCDREALERWWTEVSAAAATPNATLPGPHSATAVRGKPA